MTPSEPVDPRVRLAITQWPDDAPRGAVSTFCLEHGISRKTFYAIRKRASDEGPAAALEPKSRRPKSSPSKLSDEVKRQAIGAHAALEQPGLDHGPISVHKKMKSLGMDPVPSTASWARVFREAGVARAEPKKKPRASYRRFVYPAPNTCWQFDGDRVRPHRRPQVRESPISKPTPLRSYEDVRFRDSLDELRCKSGPKVDRNAPLLDGALCSNLASIRGFCRAGGT